MEPDPDDLSELFAPMTAGDGEHRMTVFASNPPQLPLISNGLMAVVLALNGDARHSWDGTFSNDLAASACFARSVRHHRAATSLAVTGYYTEVEPLLRSAYEASSLGRMLARNPDVSERWMRDQDWIPDGVVRRWINSFLGDGSKDDFDHFYKHACDVTHPTAKACLRSVRADEEGWQLQLSTEYDESLTTFCLEACVGAVWFSCAAIRNSLVDELALPPFVRRTLLDAMDACAKHFDVTLDRPDVEWEREDERYARIIDRLADVADLEDALDRDPRSWRNLSKPQDPATSPSGPPFR